MNYEKNYKDALKRARELQKNSNGMILKKWLWGVFPELKEKESEDEQMIERLKSCVYASDLTPEGREEILTWLEKQGKQSSKDYIKFPNSAYTSNKDVTEFADKYSHIVWEKLMNNFKKIENYSIGCNDVSDIVLNAIIDTYIWLEGKGQIKESHISQHESKTCEENNEFLTNEDERIKGTLKGFVKGYSAFINGQWRLGDFTVNRLIDWLEKQGEKKSADEVLKIRQELYQSGYNDGYKHGQEDITRSLEKESIEALEHFVRSIEESGYASPYDNRTKSVYTLLEQLKQIVK